MFHAKSSLSANLEFQSCTIQKFFVRKFKKSQTIITESCYDVLGVTIDSTSREIHKAYKKFAVDLHPDKNANV